MTEWTHSGQSRKKMQRYRARIILTLLLFAASLSELAGARCRDPQTANRVLAIADVHGGLAQFLSILRRAGLVNAENEWAGGCTTLVQVGDLVDRGPHDRQVLDLIMELQKTAPKQGGQVLVALGNHEVMNVMGDLRYVTKESFAFFGDSKTKRRRTAAFKQYEDYLQQRARFFGLPRPQITNREEAEWLAAHPPGFFAHRQAFSAQGKYGRWIRKGSAVIQHENVLYLHGGLAPELTTPIDAINKRIRLDLKYFDDYVDYLIDHGLILPFFRMDEMTSAAREEVAYWKTMSVHGNGSEAPKTNHLDILQDFLKMGSWISLHPRGPLWYRGYAEWSEEEGPAHVEAILSRYGVDHIVVGHTPMLEMGIRPRFGARIFLIDTGLYSDYYPGGQPSALEIRNGEFHAIYLTEKRKLSPEPQLAQSN